MTALDSSLIKDKRTLVRWIPVCSLATRQGLGACGDNPRYDQANGSTTTTKVAAWLVTFRAKGGRRGLVAGEELPELRESYQARVTWVGRRPSLAGAHRSLIATGTKEGTN